MSRKSQPERDRAIAQAMAAGTPARALADKYSLSPSSVYRAADRFAAVDTTPQPRARPGGPTFSTLARTGLKRFGGHIVDDYDRVFTTLSKRVALYREMGDDAICAAVLQACRMVLRQATISAETDGETDADKQAAEFLGQVWDDMAQSGTDTIDQAAGMLQYGFYPAELVYKKRQGARKDGASKYDDGRIGWRKWVFMAPDSLASGNEWEFDEQGGLAGINQTAAPDYALVNIPIEKVVLFRTTSEKGNPEGRALLRAMHSSWYMAHNLQEIEAIVAERSGGGLPIIYMGKDTKRQGTDDDLSDFTNIVRNIRVDEQMGIVIPYPKMGGGAAEGDGVLVELLSTAGTSLKDIHPIITRYEQRMAMVGLAQFIHLGMDQVGARSLGESSQSFFTLAVSAWADNIMDTINRYAVERLFALNYFPGLTAIPRLVHEPVAQTDLVQIADYINKLAGANLITPTEDMERAVLELADLPVSQKITELWKAKDKARDAAQERLLNPPETTVVGTQEETAPEAVAQDKTAPQDNAALIAELRLAVEALNAGNRAEQFYNPNHDERGRFGEGGGDGGGGGESSGGSGKASAKIPPAVMARLDQAAPGLKFEPLDKGVEGHRTAHYDPETDTIYGAETGEFSGMHEMGHALTEPVAGSERVQTSSWHVAIDDTPGAAAALADYKWANAERLPSNQRWDNNNSNPRNYEWGELQAHMVADYASGTLPAVLAQVVEAVANDYPGGRLYDFVNAKP